MGILWLALLAVICFYFFSLLQTSASVLAEELHKVWASISSGIWEVLLAFSACHLPSTHVQNVWEGLLKEMLLSVLLTPHEINLGAGKQISLPCLASGLEFCCSSELQRKQHLLCCLSLPVCRVSAACRNVRDRENCYYLGCGAVPGGFSLWEMGCWLCFRARECLINFLANRQHLKWKSFWTQSVQSAGFGVGAGLKGQGVFWV